jgi:hypothetical protein
MPLPPSSRNSGRPSRGVPPLGRGCPAAITNGTAPGPGQTGARPPALPRPGTIASAGTRSGAELVTTDPPRIPHPPGAGGGRDQPTQMSVTPSRKGKASPNLGRRVRAPGGAGEIRQHGLAAPRGRARPPISGGSSSFWGAKFPTPGVANRPGACLAVCVCCGKERAVEGRTRESWQRRWPMTTRMTAAMIRWTTRSRMIPATGLLVGVLAWRPPARHRHGPGRARHPRPPRVGPRPRQPRPGPAPARPHCGHRVTLPWRPRGPLRGLPDHPDPRCKGRAR